MSASAAPGRGIGQHARCKASGKPADGVAADEKPDREAERSRLDLLGEIGHGDGGQSAQRHAFEAAGKEKADEAGGSRSGKKEQRGCGERGRHHHLAAPRFSERAGDEQHWREQTGSERESEAARRRGNPKLGREDRQ